MTEGEIKEIEDLLRDNSLESLWSREEVRPAMVKLLAALKEKEERIEGLQHALLETRKRLAFSADEESKK